MTENLNFQCFNLKELRDSNFKCSEIKIIDLRHPEETAISQLKTTEFEVINIPYFALRKNLNILDRNAHYALYCKDGIMSKLQSAILNESGFQNISILVLE